MSHKSFYRRLILNTSALILLILVTTPIILASTYINDPDNDSTTELELWLKADEGFTPANWTDQSANTNDAAQSNPANQPALLDNQINFNPVVDFDTGDTLEGVASPINSGTDQTVFFIYQHTANGVGDQPDLFDYDGTAGGNRVEVYDDTFSYQGTLFDETNTGNTLTNANLVYIRQAQNIVNTGGISVNGEPEVTGTTAAIGGGDTYTIGTQGLLDGNLAELILYSEELNATNIDNIESYLALKYGITLDINTPQYTNSSGTTVFDTDDGGNSGAASDGTADWFDIAGIARDDATTLDQRISQSENASSSLIVSTDSDFISSNSTARPQLDDGDFLVWGHNGSLASTSTTSDLDTSVYQSRTEREWKFENTAVTSTVNLKFETLPTFNSTDYQVLLSSPDQDFSSGYSVLGESNNGEFTDITIPTGTSYMTVASATTLIELTKSSYSTVEAANDDHPSILIDGPIFTGTTLGVTIDSGTATEDTDFTISGTFAIPEGDYDGSTPIDINFEITDDGILEGTEDIDFTISNPSSQTYDFGDVDGSTTTLTSANYEITDDETASVQFEATTSNTSGDEDNAPTINLELSISTTTGSGTIATGETITAQVSYDGSSTATNGSGEDIDFTTPQTITFTDSHADGELLPISFTLTDDNVFEDDETAIFNLSIAGPGTLNSLSSVGTNNQHTLPLKTMILFL